LTLFCAAPFLQLHGREADLPCLSADSAERQKAISMAKIIITFFTLKVGMSGSLPEN
jgi:hypothetical protein